DMRALTEIRDNASDAEIKEAIEDNMTLAIQSARAIGCCISEDDVIKIIHHDLDTINNVLLNIIRARVVEIPGMDKTPSSYLKEPSFLFDQVHIPIPVVYDQ
ncbi:hypothetical protein, partial [Salmonella sp. s54836]|uniref:hypothetical protein n=1 Tax=Salmonella sp. s54836 TaxID=3159673 RepID=UPI00397F5D19